MDKEELIAKLKDKASYRVDDLVEIMKLLRTDCPWDREQTHSSIRNNFIEEAYEAVEGIDTSDTELLREELGDVLLQVIFHARIEEEAGGFDFDSVADGICRKLILRHPHIFGDVEASTSGAVLANWDQIKRESKGQRSVSSAMQGVSRALPSLMRAEKLQSKAAKVGFDWDSPTAALCKIREETLELENALRSGNGENVHEELGDLLFSVCNVSRLSGHNAEETLYKACEKFMSRFERMEKAILDEGGDMKEMTLEQMDKVWERIK